MVTTLRAKFDGKVLIPVEPVDLPTGKELEIQVNENPGPRPGSPEAISALLDRMPVLPAEDVEELNRALEEAKRPPRDKKLFDEGSDNDESQG